MSGCTAALPLSWTDLSRWRSSAVERGANARAASCFIWFLHIFLISFWSDAVCWWKIMAALQPTRHILTQDRNYGQMEARRVPSPSTVSTAELTRWITVTMEACERQGGGRRGESGWKRCSISTNAFITYQREKNKTHMECTVVGEMPTQATHPTNVAVLAAR